ncbi:MAG: hypothetical protein P8Y26_06550, partial [Gemmatimonadales bacterium]
LTEIEIVAGLQHPHILPLYDSGEADGLLYYVMPFAEGESLRRRLEQPGSGALDVPRSAWRCILCCWRVPAGASPN